MSTPEGATLKACLSYLALCNIPAWRINTMGTPLVKNGEFVKGRFRPAPSRGIADIIGIAPRTMEHLVHGIRFEMETDTPLAVECKSSVGRQSPAQREFQRKWEDAGGVYLLCRSVEELRDGLREAGVEVR